MPDDQRYILFKTAGRVYGDPRIGTLPQKEIQAEDLERYSPLYRGIIDRWGFDSDNPPTSVYGPLTPVPPGTDVVFRPPSRKLGLGAKPEGEEDE